MKSAVNVTDKVALSRFVQDECERRLRAYEAQPRDVAEHFETENEVLSGGYAYRQLYEVVQNAADAIIESGEDSGRIHVKLAGNRLEAANTGAALGEEGIIALLNARSSSKRGNQIGRFGIGFKSLLKLGGRIDLVSRSIGLRFDPDACRQKIRDHLGLRSDARAPGMRLAEVLVPDSASLLSPTFGYGWATTVVSARITDDSVFRRVSEEMESFPPEFLLFLQADIELDIEVEGTATRRISKRVEGDVSVVSDGTNETRWKLFETRVRIESAEARADATHIQARDDIPLAWAVPVGGREQAGRFWAFFPTETHSLTSGILNAPWKLNSDRTNLIRGPWNEAIMKAAAELIAASLPALPTLDDQGAAVSAFPRQPDRQDEIAVPLIKALWDRIIESKILPSVDTTVHLPSDVTRHFIEDADICASWSVLANASAKKTYLHPNCYSLKTRISRLNALDMEAKRRDAKVPSRASAKDWLDCLGNPDPFEAKKSLVFVGSVLENGRAHSLYGVPETRLIPTMDGSLATPSQAILASGGNAPAGFLAVERTIASDPRCRAILVDLMNVRELAPHSWGDVLEASLEAAEGSDAPTDWENFWQNVASAQVEAKEKFLQGVDHQRLKFRAKTGNWVSRQLLVVGGTASNLSDVYAMDMEFRQSIQPHVPKEWLTEFPSIGETVGGDLAEIKGYLLWIKPHFDAVCRERVGSTPQYLPKISGNTFLMPAGWRLIPHLQPGIAATLTLELIRNGPEYSKCWAPVTITHPTRENAYPRVSAPHPFYYWLTERGRIQVGQFVFPLKVFSVELAATLAAAKIGGFDHLTWFFDARDQGPELRPHVALTRPRLAPDALSKFWKEIFTQVMERRDGFASLRDVWELAHSEGAVPENVPTSSGALRLSEIYVTTHSGIAGDLDDGRVVLLSAAASSEWISAGAQLLEFGPVISFRERLSETSHLLDHFPELAVVPKIGDSADKLLVVWVEGLEEQLGPFRRAEVVTMDGDGALIIDRHRFESREWAEGIGLLLRCLSRNGVIEDSENSDVVFAHISDRRAEKARKAVREEPSLERRLLKAVGEGVKALLEIMTPATRQAIGEEGDPEDAARLALAVHGPALLSRLRGALELQGLAPPKRWGGEQTRAFVLEIGFPLEFASTVGGRKDPELSISGPINLPPLHDYQEEILSDIGRLLSSGAGRRRAVVSLPTGGGKTRVAAEGAVRLVLRGEQRRSVLWIAQTDELCEQAVQCFRQLWVNIGEPSEDLRIVRLWGGQRNPAPSEGDEATVVVASIQTLNSRRGRAEIAWIAQAGIIIIDECHHAIAASYTDLLRWLDIQVGTERARERETPVIGLSATPWRGYNEEESHRLASRFDQRWFPADQAGLYEKLSDMGVLAERSYKPLRYDRPITLTERERQHVDTFGELPDSVVDRIGEDDDRNDLIIETVLRSKAESILLFANSVTHAQYLAAKLHLAGCPAAAVSGQTDRLARQHFTKRFRSGDLRIICNHSVLTTGFDAPKADMVLISRPVFSPVLYMQMVGRGLRGPANGGTEYCEIVTVEDNISSFKDRLAFHFCRRFFDP